MSAFTGIFFDLDGTLGATGDDIRNAWLTAIARLGLRCERFDAVFRIGPSVPETASLLFPDQPEAVRKLAAETYKQIYDNADSYTALPYPGVVAAVRELSRRSKIYVVTNKRLKPTLKLLNKFGLTPVCSGILTPDVISVSYQLGKSDMVALALRLSGAEAPSSVLMVGDTEIDIEAGKRCGVTTCGVTWGYGDLSKLQAADPDHLIERPKELIALRV